jgi:hypothetical protein
VSRTVCNPSSLLQPSPTIPDQKLRLDLVDSGTVNLPDGTSVLRVVTASDWMTTGPTRTITIDARSSAISNDGKENMDFAYLGKMEITPEVEEVISGKSGKEMEFGDCYYYTTPRIYSRCERWAWVNDTVFVAAGKLRLEEGRPVVSYRIYKVG